MGSGSAELQGLKSILSGISQIFLSSMKVQ